MDRTIDEIRELFAADRFATERAGIKIDEARKPEGGRGGLARCTMEIAPGHSNAGGTVMGGAIFTLADFCFAVLSNAWEPVPCTATISASIRYVGTCRGKRLVGSAEMDRAGRTLLQAHCRIEDDLGNLVALCEATFIRMAPPPPRPDASSKSI